MISDTRKTWGWSINRQYRRRWIVAAYWLLSAFFAWALLRHTVRHNGFSFDVGLLNILVFFPALLGGVRAGGAVKPFRNIYWPSLEDRVEMVSLFHNERNIAAQAALLDERETRLRDRVHFVAYTVSRWLALALFLLYGFAGMMGTEWLTITGPTFFFLLTMVLWSLPQSIILWNEPDVEAEA
jgi:hypothetical protein